MVFSILVFVCCIHKAIMGHIFEERDKHVYYLFYIFSWWKDTELVWMGYVLWKGQTSYYNNLSTVVLTFDPMLQWSIGHKWVFVELYI